MNAVADVPHDHNSIMGLCGFTVLFMAVVISAKLLAVSTGCVCRDEALYSSTNGGSRYTFDPDYGGKVSMPTAHHPLPARPDTLMSRAAPDASRPRALFADDRSRYATPPASLTRNVSMLPVLSQPQAHMALSIPLAVIHIGKFHQ